MPYQPNPQQGGMPPPPTAVMPQPGMGMAPPMQMGMPLQQQSSASNEELIEAIIEEKWNDLVKDINKIIEWKNGAEGRLVAMDQQIKDMKNEFDKLHTAVVGKVGEYDKHVLDLGSEIKAMEQVFAKVLPAFTKNVDELSRATDDIKFALGKK